jgi:hypothetical protein
MRERERKKEKENERERKREMKIRERVVYILAETESCKREGKEDNKATFADFCTFGILDGGVAWRLRTSSLHLIEAVSRTLASSCGPEPLNGEKERERERYKEYE